MGSVVQDGLKGLAPVETLPPAGVMPNAKHQTFDGFMTGAPYELAITEFDDQGRSYDRAQLDAIAARLDVMRANGTDAIIIVFTHGWKHDGRSDDTNLNSFRGLLTKAAAYERSTAGAGKPRPVMGIFVAWRGLTTYDSLDAAADVTFWGRQEAAYRVSTGSVRELFGRLRHYRNAREKGSPLLVIAGHSFAGRIVYSALAQSLIEAASDPSAEMDSRFADLVLLVNPAIEGGRYLPIYDLIRQANFSALTKSQAPLFICAQADNDQPVGTWFPVGNFKNGLDEASIGDLEKRCITHAIGFIDEFRTHRLDVAPGSDYVLSPQGLEQANPYWVVRASKPVIDGHSGIWQAPFEAFLADILFQQIGGSG